jgi:hypothetical protein
LVQGAPADGVEHLPVVVLQEDEPEQGLQAAPLAPHCDAVWVANGTQVPFMQQPLQPAHMLAPIITVFIHPTQAPNAPVASQVRVPGLLAPAQLHVVVSPSLHVALGLPMSPSDVDGGAAHPPRVPKVTTTNSVRVICATMPASLAPGPVYP